MALLTYALGSEVGLRLLLSPSASQVAVRAACTLFGIGFPIYSTHKAIAYKNLAEQEQWLFYWAVYGCFTATEVVFDKLFSWYHHTYLSCISCSSFLDGKWNSLCYQYSSLYILHLYDMVILAGFRSTITSNFCSLSGFSFPVSLYVIIQAPLFYFILL
jgi:hypothetical protein